MEYFRQALKVRGVNRVPRNWHLKQLATARAMLAGENAPTVEEWKACIDWAFEEPYWKDRIDHLARIEALWPRFVLQCKKVRGDKKSEILRKLYLA